MSTNGTIQMVPLVPSLVPMSTNGTIQMAQLVVLTVAPYDIGTNGNCDIGANGRYAIDDSANGTNCVILAMAPFV